MEKSTVTGMGRRQWLLGSAGLASAVLLPGSLFARAAGLHNPCWGGRAPCNAYTPVAIKRVNAHLPFHFEIAKLLDRPVIDVRRQLPGYCLEGGKAVKVGGLYRLFSTAFPYQYIGKPSRLVYWVSKDGGKWDFRSTILRPQEPVAGRPGFAPWGPTPVFNSGENRWYLIYSTYKYSGPGPIDSGTTQGVARARMMVSTVKGRERGIDGPWRDLGTVMRPDAASQPWEGVQGVDSFYPYQARNGRWYAMYGSSNWKSFWRIGLATAPGIRGPWKRCPTGNPLRVEPVFLENPIVSRIGDWYVAIYDAVAPGNPAYTPNGHITGYTCSKDGIHWLPGGRILVQPSGPASWAYDLRTPLSLIPEGQGIYTMFYTGYERKPWTAVKENEWMNYESVGMARLRIVWHGRNNL